MPVCASILDRPLNLIYSPLALRLGALLCLYLGSSFVLIFTRLQGVVRPQCPVEFVAQGPKGSTCPTSLPSELGAAAQLGRSILRGHAGPTCFGGCVDVAHLC